MRIDKRRLYHLDWFLIINGLALFGIGILNMVSATSSFYSGSYNFIIKQLAAFVIGLIIILIILHFDYRVIAHQSKVAILVCTVFHRPRPVDRHDRRRSEKMDQHLRHKPAAVGVHETRARPLPCQHAFQKKRENVALGLKGIAAPILWTLIPFFLIVKQPDLGTGIISSPHVPCHALVRGLEKIHILILGCIGAVTPFIVWKFLLKPYQKMRIFSFINIDADPSGFGYHAKQAMIAVGSGKFLGKAIWPEPSTNSSSFRNTIRTYFYRLRRGVGICRLYHLLSPLHQLHLQVSQNIHQRP